MAVYGTLVNVFGVVLVVISVLVLLFAFLAWKRSKQIPIFLEALRVQLDGRLTQLLVKTDEAGKLMGRAAERADQLIRDQQAQVRSDATRLTYTTEQADKIVTAQEQTEPRERP